MIGNIRSNLGQIVKINSRERFYTNIIGKTFNIFDKNASNLTFNLLIFSTTPINISENKGSINQTSSLTESKKYTQPVGSLGCLGTN
jgi:hypothetical protein